MIELVSACDERAHAYSGLLSAITAHERCLCFAPTVVGGLTRALVSL